jgi:hypothetical protein
MSPDDLMKPDLISEILLVGSGMILLIGFVTLVVAAFLHSAPLR